ncbi:MAG: hypothetical protein WC637_02755 [Victivallales bacterium]
MKSAGKKSTRGLKGDCEISSEIEKIIEHVEKSGNCEFVRILELCSKMDAADMEKFLEYAEKL